jgi:hypothetical protein
MAENLELLSHPGTPLSRLRFAGSMILVSIGLSTICTTLFASPRPDEEEMQRKNHGNAGVVLLKTALLPLEKPHVKPVVTGMARHFPPP